MKKEAYIRQRNRAVEQAVKLAESRGHIDTFLAEDVYLYLEDTLAYANGLDEPQKPVVPQFVADWIESQDDPIYEIEKEKKYRVVFRSHKDDLILFQTGEHIFIGAESANNGYWKQHFTEVEIKAIDERYWAFAEKIEE